MKAMILDNISPVEREPLRFVDLPIPEPSSKEILVKVSTCGICHTELDEIEGRIQPNLPIIPGHQIVGTVEGLGPMAKKFNLQERVGIAWINSSCGRCQFCDEGRENLCLEFKATGCNANGGYAQYTTVREDFAYPIPDQFSDTQAAPLLCAGAIGYRNLRLSGIKRDQILGLFGFGASAHIVIQMARYLGYRVYVFSRSEAHRELAKLLGAQWTGHPDDNPPEKLHSAIDFTPVGETVPLALSLLEKGGRLVLAVIRKRNPIPPLDYTRLLWDEKEIKSVANVTRKDVEEFLSLASRIPIIPEVTEFELKDANRALILLKQGKIQGAGVLRISD